METVNTVEFALEIPKWLAWDFVKALEDAADKHASPTGGKDYKRAAAFAVLKQYADEQLSDHY